MARSVVIKELSKQYRVGRLQQETTLGETLRRWVKHPFRRRSKETIWALKDVSFEVESGEVVGIIGRNGAGKSTLLKVLAHITRPTSGQVQVQGRIASLLEVGTGFHEELTGRENVYLNGAILGMKKKEIDRHLDAIVEFADVARFIDTPIKRYSTGMRLRLGFSVAAHLDPEVMLVDEVLAVGDVGFQKKCLNAMDGMRGGGRTVFFVSHNMAAVENLCSRAIWIDNGQVRQDGDAREVIRAYMSTFSENKGARVDLDEGVSRTGSGDIRFTRLEFLDPDRNLKSCISSGDALVLRLHYRAKKRMAYPHFGVEIRSNLGTLITDVSTWSTGEEIPSLAAGDGYVDLEIDFLNLMPGHYYITLWSANVGAEVYDTVQNCSTLEVETSNFYGSGRGIESRCGLIFLPCSWHLDGLGRQGAPKREIETVEAGVHSHA